MQPRRRILYTEDDADTRELIRFVFTRRGYEIVCAESGAEALELARVEPFDLFLVDNWMPELTGVELLDTLERSIKSLQSFSILARPITRINKPL